MTTARTSAISDREAEVLAAVGAHLSNAQIGSRMHISVRTVESHVSSLLRKLDAPDRKALADLATGMRPVDGMTPGEVAGAPALWTTFVGRNAERSAALTAIAESRLVTLVGPGGVGKTRLAAVAAEAGVADGSVLGGVFVDLVPVQPEFVPQAVAEALGVSERPGESPEEAVRERLGQTRWLVVLDNCEHVLDTVAEFVGRLLVACPGTVVLATSRERLGLPGEQVLPVAPLSVLAAPAGVSEAANLFLDRAGVGAADPAAVERLCARLDGMPLAIELAAARSASLGTDGLSAGLEDYLRLLAGGRTTDERHRSLRSVLDWSHDLLDEEERTLFARLGVFVGGFDLDAASSVGALGERGHTVDVIGRLADKSLLRHRPGPGASRWRMLDTIRAYALDRLAATDDPAAVRHRYLAWAADAATDLENRLTGDGWRRDFDLRADDLRHALSTATDRGLAYRLAGALGHLTYARRYFTESRQHYQHAAELAPGPAEAATALRHASDVARAEGRAGLSFDLLLATAEQARAAADPARAQECLATAVDVANRFPAAFPAEIPYERLRPLLDSALELSPPASPESAAKLALAVAWNWPEKCTPDPQLAREALAAARTADEPLLISDALDAVASAESNAGHFREAHRCGRERIALLRRMPRHNPSSAMEIIDIFHVATDNAVMAGDLRFAVSVAQRLQDEDIVAGYGRLMISKPLVPLVLQGRFDEALLLGGRVWQEWHRAGRPTARWMAPAVYSLALVHGLRGDQAQSERWRSRTYEMIQSHDPGTARNLILFADFADARIALQEGHLEETPVELLLGKGWYETQHWYFDAYAWAVGAEMAVVADRSDAAELLEVAAPAGTENAWAAACLARARWRLTGDPADLAASLAGWDSIGAAFEYAYTEGLAG